MQRKDKSASELLAGVVTQHHMDTISFAEIKTLLHERGFGLLMIIFALPLAVPLPVPPGITAVPAIPLMFFSFQMVMGMSTPWLPKWIGRKQMKRSTIAWMIEKASPYLRKVEMWMRPRFSFASSKIGEKIVGFFSLIFAISILVPLPFTNFIPAIGIVLMSLGILSKDGIIIILGMLIGSIGIGITVSIVLYTLFAAF